MGTLLFAFAVLGVYGLVAAYGFRDVFVAHRDREERDEPILAAWHFILAVLSFLAAGAMILGGLLVTVGGPHSRSGWWESPSVAAGVLLDIVVGAFSILLGFVLVRYTRQWLAPNIGKPRAVRRARRHGGAHHAR